MSWHPQHENGAHGAQAANGATGAHGGDGAYPAMDEPQVPPNVYQPMPHSAPRYEEYADPAAAHGWQNAFDRTAELPVIAAPADAYPPDGQSVDAFPSGGHSADAYPPDGQSVDAFPSDGHSADGCPPDGHSVDAFPPDGYAADAFPPDGHSAGPGVLEQYEQYVGYGDPGRPGERAEDDGPAVVGGSRRHGRPTRRVPVAVGGACVLLVAVVAGLLGSGSGDGPRPGTRGQEEGAKKKDGVSVAPVSPPSGGAESTGSGDAHPSASPSPTAAEKSASPTAAASGGTADPTTAPAATSAAATTEPARGNGGNPGRGKGATKGPR
ncbi:hypothetical protein ABT301_24485 [Streptomyces sp. NPDC000987]|uniref:hypothetical protein n=1 Tax=Streptomyces sp. NPDC000987 TaxID=3154374 RepID=UPI00331BBC51